MSMLRNLMSAKVRSNAGCWTCRLRRKKCDERRPVCDACKALEITCHFDEEKPGWMDGGARQRDMADKIKSQVKKQASQRRDRKYMEILESGTRIVRLGPRDGDAGAKSNGNGNTNGQRVPHSDSQTSGNKAGVTPPSSNASVSPPEVPWTSQLFERQGASDDGGPDVDVHFIMIYLDYIFPYLFPYYRPPVLSGGRGWVLDIVQSNKSVYYTTISLASYFFGVLLANGDEQHNECTKRMARKLQKQLEMGLRELQKEMHTINSRGTTGFDMQESLRVWQAIIQMVVFEVATSNGDNWKMHLDAAIAMFFHILPNAEQWTDTLHGLGTLSWPPPSMGLRRPWSTGQAALRFFTANLFNMDVMSSIALERPPRLRGYQDSIIPGCFSQKCRENAQAPGPLFMDDFVGLHNWIIQMIGDVATLDAWKKEQMQAGTLSVDDLGSRGQVLADAIRGSLDVLDQVHPSDSQETMTMMDMVVEDPLPELRNVVSEDMKGYHPTMALHNKVWLQGVLVYLYTVVFGWRPNEPDVKSNVSSITELLTKLPRGACLRGMVWPFCIAGCLSPPEDEDKYRAIVSRLGPLKVFGNIKEASEILEKVWSRRDLIDESWDVAKCLQILGHHSLLI